MRSLLRNKKSFEYALYEGSTEILDKYGDPTGDRGSMYGERLPYKANVSPNTGISSYGFFGIDNNYSHVITTTDMSCPITEDSLIFMNDKRYVVVKRAESLNNIVIAIKEV